jgi:hypothetical protein
MSVKLLLSFYCIGFWRMQIMEHGASQYMYDYAYVYWWTELSNYFFFIGYVCVMST